MNAPRVVAAPYVPALALGVSVAGGLAGASLVLSLLADGVGWWLPLTAVAAVLVVAGPLGETFHLPPFPAPPDDVELEVRALSPVAVAVVAAALGLFALALVGFPVVGVGGGAGLAAVCARGLRHARAREAATGGRIVRYTRRASGGGRVAGYAVVVAGEPGVSAVPGAPEGPTLSELAGGP